MLEVGSPTRVRAARGNNPGSRVEESRVVNLRMKASLPCFKPHRSDYCAVCEFVAAAQTAYTVSAAELPLITSASNLTIVPDLICAPGRMSRVKRPSGKSTAQLHTHMVTSRYQTSAVTNRPVVQRTSTVVAEASLRRRRNAMRHMMCATVRTRAFCDLRRQCQSHLRLSQIQTVQ